MTHIEGIFRLSSPLHCAMPVSDDKANRTRTMVQPVVTSRGITSVPYFPANDVRGRLRRCAADFVIAALARRGETITADLFVAMSSGSPLGVIENVTTIEEIERAREHVYMGLFGGGGRMLRSRFMASDLMPVLGSTIEAGTVPAGYGEEPFGFVPKAWANGGKEQVNADGRSLIKTFWYTRIDDLMRITRQNSVLAIVADPLESVAAYQARSATTRKAKASAADTDEGDKPPQRADASMIFEIEAIATGTPLYGRFDFAPDTTEAQIGFFLLCLHSLVRKQSLGGKGAGGFGRYVADLRLHHAGQTMPVFTQPGAHDAELSNSVKDLVAAGHAGIASFDLAGLRSFFEPSKSE